MTHSNRPLIAAGLSVFGSAYAISLITSVAFITDGGRESEKFAPLLIPVIGPFITMGTAEDVTAIMTLDGVTQITGATLMIIGIAMSEKQIVRNDITSEASWKKPEVFAGPTSLRLRWRF